MKSTKMMVVLCVVAAIVMSTASVYADCGGCGTSHSHKPAPKKAAPTCTAPDMSKPVQVYILMGQSNMLGFGKVGQDGQEGALTNAVKSKGLYPYLVDENGNWVVRNDVRNVFVMKGGVRQDNWMTIKGGKIGPEIGIGHAVGNVEKAPVLILKSCIGNRSLGWDLLPPGSKQYNFTDSKGVEWVHPGYKGSPERWKKGETPKPIGWYAGKQWDDDISGAKKVLAQLDKYISGAKGYEVAGFFWWQGDKDRYKEGLASKYEENLVHLIKTLRKEFNAPKAKFVCATLGQTKKGAKGNEGMIIEAMLNVDGKKGKYPEFKGNVATVYSNPLSKGGASNGHYSRHAETYMNVGEGMGKAMADMLKPKGCCPGSRRK